MSNLDNKIKSLIKSVKAKCIFSEEVFKGNFITLIKESYILPNNKILNRERIIKNKNKQAVIIIAITTENKFLIVSQNRINDIVSLEFPSGYVENGESVIEAAKRELVEETGYTSNNIKKIDSYYASIGIDSSIINIVIAFDCIKVSSQNLGETEYIKYSDFTFKELEKLIDLNYINSSSNRLAFYELKAKNLF